MRALPLPADQPRRGHSRSKYWTRVSQGLYAPAGDRATALELATWQLAMPARAAFSHLTAAEYLGWWLPKPMPHPVFVAMSGTTGGPERPGLFVCRHPRPVPTLTHEGIRVTTAGETLLAAARDLGVLDLVVMGDSALRLGHCTVDELWETAARRRRGAPLLRAVLPLLDKRSESAWESMLRVLHVTAGIPVEPQYEVVSRTGAFLAWADLWVVGTRRMHEYDGAVHRSPETHQQDLRRERGLLADGWQRYGYTAAQVLAGWEIITGVDRELGRLWDPARKRAWDALVTQSSWGSVGRARAQARWVRATPVTTEIAAKVRPSR